MVKKRVKKGSDTAIFVLVVVVIVLSIASVGIYFAPDYVTANEAVVPAGKVKLTILDPQDAEGLQYEKEIS